MINQVTEMPHRDTSTKISFSCAKKSLEIISARPEQGLHRDPRDRAPSSFLAVLRPGFLPQNHMVIAATPAIPDWSPRYSYRYRNGVSGFQSSLLSSSVGDSGQREKLPLGSERPVWDSRGSASGLWRLGKCAFSWLIEWRSFGSFWIKYFLWPDMLFSQKRKIRHTIGAK